MVTTCTLLEVNEDGIVKMFSDRVLKHILPPNEINAMNENNFEQKKEEGVQWFLVHDP